MRPDITELYGGGAPDPRIVDALRASVAPPGQDAFWGELERAILDRISRTERGWWSVLHSWMPSAIVAAACAALVAGLALWRAEEVAAHEAYETALVMAATPVGTAAAAPESQWRDAADGYLIDP